MKCSGRVQTKRFHIGFLFIHLCVFTCLSYHETIITLSRCDFHVGNLFCFNLYCIGVYHADADFSCVSVPIQQDFRRCQSLIQSISASSNGSFPPTKPTKHEQLAAQNVQRGLAAKVQELSATFRKKQRVYMESKYAPPLVRCISFCFEGNSTGFACNRNGCAIARFAPSVFCFDVDVQRIYRGFLFAFFFFQRSRAMRSRTRTCSSLRVP